MKYLFLCALLLSIPAHAEFGFDNGIRKPQSLVVSGDSVIDDNDDTAEKEEQIDTTQIPVEDEFPIGGPDLPQKPIDPFTTPPTVTPPKTVIKKVVKPSTPIQAQRAINDDRIDDSYVQGLINKNFSVTTPIE